jgi:hypothetical protein
MNKDIQYNNEAHATGMLFSFGENQIRVYIKTILEIDYEYNEHDRQDRLLTGQDGETEIRWHYTTMNDIDLIATIVDREGRDVFYLCEASTSEHTMNKLLKMVMLEGGGTLGEMIKDEIENEGPDQIGGDNTDDAWIEALEHNERDAKDEAMAAKYPEQV